MKLTDVKQLPADGILIEYIKEAVDLNEQRKKPAAKKKKKAKKPEMRVPDDLSAALKKKRSRHSKGLARVTGESTSNGSLKPNVRKLAKNGSPQRPSGWPTPSQGTGNTCKRSNRHLYDSSSGKWCPSLSRLVARYWALCSFTGGKMGT